MLQAFFAAGLVGCNQFVKLKLAIYLIITCGANSEFFVVVGCSWLGQSYFHDLVIRLCSPHCWQKLINNFVETNYIIV